MPPRSPLLVLQARGPVSLGLRQHLATGERLEVTEGSDLGGLLCDLHPEAQLARFGRVVFDVVSEPTDDHEAGEDPYVHAHVPDHDHERPTQRPEDGHRGRPHLRLVRTEEDSP